ncbi:MAG: hypothetical protein HYU41_26765 [Candidatus Rokubacteria bacterium]|nr:hypothetical protein [Candidatus Rokubacteria bacterium]
MSKFLRALGAVTTIAIATGACATTPQPKPLSAAQSLVVASTLVDPAQVADVTREAIELDRADAEAIAAIAVTSAPGAAADITRAAVEAAPERAADIKNAARRAVWDVQPVRRAEIPNAGTMQNLIEEKVRH